MLTSIKPSFAEIAKEMKVPTALKTHFIMLLAYAVTPGDLFLSFTNRKVGML